MLNYCPKFQDPRSQDQIYKTAHASQLTSPSLCAPKDIAPSLPFSFFSLFYWVVVVFFFIYIFPSLCSRKGSNHRKYELKQVKVVAEVQKCTPS